MSSELAAASSAKLEPRPRLAPTRLYTGYSISAEEFGGKAASLAALNKLGLMVPRAWGYPCSASIERPLLEFPTEWGTGEYSVRSGAPVSMPGMLKTRLGVKLPDIRAAIRSVWNSWDEPHARLYREVNHISHTMGTGCIVQKMPPGIQWSGVAFTSDPSDYASRMDFAPVIEGVMGTGDALVSGESSGVVITPDVIDSSICSSLTYGLKLIHDAWGPSDTEWCTTDTGYLYWLQWRALKFAVPTPTEEDAGRTVITIGKSIASKRVVIAKLADAAGFKDGDVLYLSAFAPEIYPLMMRAAGIATQSGGETCHAAIVARTMGLPAISGVLEDDAFPYLGKVVRLNGQTGTLTLPTGKDKSDAPIVVVPPPKIAPVVPDLSHRCLRWNAQQLLCRFYKAIHDQEQGTITTDRLEEISCEIAQVFAAYQYIICATEARWASSTLWKKGDNALAAPLIDKARLLGIPINALGECKGERSSFASMIAQPPNMAHAIAAMEAVSSIFNNCFWGANPGAGGPKWGAITDHLLEYLRGNTSTVLYVDGNFNRHHNGGLYFNKFDWMTAGGSSMAALLDARQSGYKALVATAGMLTSLPVVVAESLFTKGLLGSSGEHKPRAWVAGKELTIAANVEEEESDAGEEENDLDLSDSEEESDE